MRILITGANGQLGQELQQLVTHYPELQLDFYTKEQWDICQSDTSASILDKSNSKFLINAAAYTKVDLAEDEYKLCYQINSEAPKKLAQLCKSTQTKLIHISTDYVFNTGKTIPITEDEIKNPIGIYATSKSLGEDWILDENHESIIIRTSWLYSSFGHNFVKTMYKLAGSGNPLKIVSDQVGNPTYAKDLAKTILQMISNIIKQNNFNSSGIYHYSNLGNCSWYEFAEEIFKYLNIDVHLNKISTAEFGAKAWRPLFSSLDCSKIQNEFNIKIPNWKTSLHECLDIIRSNENKMNV